MKPMMKARKARTLLWVLSPLGLMLFYNNCAQQQDIAIEDPASLSTDVGGPAPTPDTGWNPGTGDTGGSTWTPGIVGDNDDPPANNGGGGGTEPPAPSEPTEDGAILSGVFETTVGGATTKPLDIVWVIDNSASMDAEAAHVRNNFNRFISSVGSAADIRVALISKAGTSGTSVSLPVTGSAYKQINQMVASTNSLSLTAAALCPATGGGAACNDSRLSKSAPIRGGLRDFLRTNSHKVFVFVTDDNSAYPRADFMKVFNEVFPSDVAVIYGFVGASKAASPCIAKPGTAYVELAQQTAGAVYNICDTDWTSTFNTLATSVINLASSTTLLPASVLSAVAMTVYVDGVVVPPGSYVIDGSGIQFSSAVIAGRASYNLRIVYYY